MPLALRRTSCYGGHPSPAPLLSAYFCKQKKSTDSNPYGLPSVALAKDGGGYITWQRTFLPMIFYAQTIKKVRRCNASFDRELQNCEKVSGNQKIQKTAHRTFPAKSSFVRNLFQACQVKFFIAREYSP